MIKKGDDRFERFLLFFAKDWFIEILSEMKLNIFSIISWKRVDQFLLDGLSFFQDVELTAGRFPVLCLCELFEQSVFCFLFFLFELVFFNDALYGFLLRIVEYVFYFLYRQAEPAQDGNFL